ncbi:uncharacterized protein C8A04DRAFT_11273 [Dichotomopilus funicola]|uniref:Uncharacterized protein n=1 Tax=Dichotomopilus funicola TaxID=1934379 RepID=A0AAN6ZNN7_9PEZI|nr:hypothetical protein C8A04DRAFT_11273 [Dichotomopilus funicola]
MGGLAFSSSVNPPHIPRMPPAVYRYVAAACSAVLRELFVYVATPIEGPGKTDHGDVDVLVALERRVVFPRAGVDSKPKTPIELMEEIKHRLRTKHALVHWTGTSANLAIPWPSDMEDCTMAPSSAAEVNVPSGEAADPKPKYVQVDIRICTSADQLFWALYKHAHGDLWNLLGSIIRPFGLTIDEEALWVRIPEIEKLDRKKAKVCLSRDPVEILHFLGMQVEGFWSKPFASVEALYDYATTCRLFWIQDLPSDDEAIAPSKEVNNSGVIGGEEGRKRLKSNDRRRMKGREVYRRWVEEFIPALRAQGKFVHKAGPGTTIEEMRAVVRDEAFSRFFVRPEYEHRLREWRLQRDSEQMKALLKKQVPDTLEPQKRSCLIGALKKIIMEHDTSYGVDTSSFRDADGFYDMEVVGQFIQGNLTGLGEIAWANQQKRAREAMRLKACGCQIPGGLCHA